VSLAGWTTQSDAHPVWVVGLGVETQIWGNWTGRLEYLYLGGGSVSTSLAVPGGTVTLSNTVHDNVIRTGLNYHF
jgi:outer membrane immunogenic protein